MRSDRLSQPSYARHLRDIKNSPTREGLLYLSAAVDLGSRRCVGWAGRDTMEVDLVTSALRMARDARKPAPGLIFNSVRGSQHASASYRADLEAHGMLARMSGKGHCYGHAVAESFFATLGFELIVKPDWHIRAEARRAIFRHIETWHNRERRRSTLGYVRSAEYEAQLQLAACSLSRTRSLFRGKPVAL